MCEIIGIVGAVISIIAGAIALWQNIKIEIINSKGSVANTIKTGEITGYKNEETYKNGKGFYLIAKNDKYLISLPDNTTAQRYFAKIKCGIIRKISLMDTEPNIFFI